MDGVRGREGGGGLSAGAVGWRERKGRAGWRRIWFGAIRAYEAGIGEEHVGPAASNFQRGFGTRRGSTWLAMGSTEE